MGEIAAPSVDYGLLLPLVVPALGAMLLIVLAAVPRVGIRVVAALALLTLGVSWALLMPLWERARPAFEGMIVADNFLVYTGGLLLAVTALSVLLSVPYLEREGLAPAEYFALLLFVTSGGLFLLAATNLLMTLLGLEILSLSLYVLTGYARGRTYSGEAAMKYFLLGAFSVGFMIYGIALLYGATGSLEYSRLVRLLDPENGLATAGVALVFVGFAFKLALVPFHMWTPDAYAGAPTSVTAFMSVATKVATFGALLRLLQTALPRMEATASALLFGLAIATMVWGNLAAVVQDDMKRMLAYSSIGQAGYVLVAVAAGGEGRAATGYYLLAYAVTNLGAFGAVLAAGGGGDDRLQIRSYAGLGRDRPLVAALLSLFLLSLAGVPPTAGFWAKLFAFRAAVSEGRLTLAVVGVVTSAVAAYYYIRIVALMYMSPSEADQNLFATSASTARIPAPLLAALLVALILTVALGILPDLPSGLTGAEMLRVRPTSAGP